MSDVRTWITSRIAECRDCGWSREGVDDSVNKAAYAHAKRHRHKVILESAKVTHYDFREATNDS